MAKRVTRAATESTRVIFEKDKVRVVELVVKKGTKADMHTHPAYFVYAVTEFAYNSTSPEGKRLAHGLKPSQVNWSDGESHSVEFSRPGRAVVVDLKGKW